jgi:sulfide:quinone oxidoreductase
LAASLRGSIAAQPPEEYQGHVMCFLETGYGKASMLNFDYNKPPEVAQPSHLVHYEKMVFNKAYWYLVPTGVL